MLIDAQAGQVFATVRTLDAQTGALLRTVAVGGMEPHDMHRIAVVTLGSRVYVSAAGLKILETSTDALFQNVAARGGTVAVDEQLGRVHVANYGANRVDVLNADRHKYCAPFRSAQRHPTLLSTWWRDECSS